MLSHEDVQAALSARLDGESSGLAGLDDDLVDAHLEQCGQCQTFWLRASSLSSAFARAETDVTPPADLSEVILAGVEGEWRRFARRRAAALALMRVWLGCMSAAWAVWAVQSLPELARVEDADAMSVAVRLGVALALGFAVWRPAQIPGILLLVGTMFTFTLGFAVRDILLESARGVVGPLFLLAATFVALAATWAVDRGADIRRAWKLLGADPA